MKLIDKNALVVEIERRLNELYDSLPDECNTGKYTVLESFRKFIDTLEVKEDNLLTEKPIERELAEAYINVFDKKFGNKLPKLKGTQLHDFKNFINTCEQTFHMKYFDYHAAQGKLFEKLALLWAAWGKEHLSTEVKEVDLDNHTIMEEIRKCGCNPSEFDVARHFFELVLKAQKGE